jgi:hypothetical protein
MKTPKKKSTNDWLAPMQAVCSQLQLQASCIARSATPSLVLHLGAAVCLSRIEFVLPIVIQSYSFPQLCASNYLSATFLSIFPYLLEMAALTPFISKHL